MNGNSFERGSGEVDILHAQPRAIHQRSHQPFVTGQVRRHRFHLIACHHHGQARRLASADDLAQVANLASDNVPAEEQQCRTGLVLRRSADFFLHSRIGEECVDLRFWHFHRVANVVKIDEPFDPVAIGLLCASVVVA